MTKAIPRIGQDWCARSIASFNGMGHTHIDTGEDYPTISLYDVFTMEPGQAEKSKGLACIPSVYHDYDARCHKTQQKRGAFVALAADIDSGNHSLATIQSTVVALCKGAAWLIYSSAHATAGDMRWRIFIPTADALAFEDWNDAQNALFNLLDRAGFQCDRALERAGQPVFLPNVPEYHGKTGERLRAENGSTLYFQTESSGCAAPALDITTGPIAAEIALIRQHREADERERERIRAEAERRRMERATQDGASIIDEFNANNSIRTLFELYGYEQSPRNGDDWRSPMQTSESYATRIYGDRWVSLSGSDTGARIGHQFKGGCFGDAYDLFLHFEHGGDQKSAFRTLYGERRSATLSPPPVATDDPGWSEPPLGPDEGDEIAIVPPVIEQEAIAKTNRALPIEWAGQVEPIIDGFWLVDDWLPSNGIAAVYGHPGSGKSFWMMHVAAHIAEGREWAGKRVEQGLVVYVVAEGQTGFRNRLYAMQQAGEIGKEVPFAFIPCPIDMQAPDGDVDALIEAIKSAEEHAGCGASVVVLDTLSKTFGAGKENTDDMVPYVNNCQRVATEFNCLTCIVHHRPKDNESRDLRGHSSLRGNIDTAILIEAGDIKTATTIKQKDGEDNLVMRFKLNQVQVGVDRHGKQVTSCLVELTDERPEQDNFAGLSPKEQEALEVLWELYSLDKYDLETGEIAAVPPPILSSGWKDALRLRGTISGTNEETARRQFNRFRKTLEKKGKIEIDGASVRPIDESRDKPGQ